MDVPMDLVLPIAEIPAAVLAAVVAAAGTLTGVLLAGRAEALKLRSQYRQQERNQLRELIGEFHGRMLETAIDWDRRMWQLYDDDGTWLRSKDGEQLVAAEYAKSEQYLFRSYVFRFLSLCAIARKFETQAFYIDAQARIARERDLDFLKYAKGFLWAMTHADLTPQDGMPGSDHFPNDQFRPLLDLCYRHDVDGIPGTAVGDDDVIFDFRRFGAFAARVVTVTDDAEQEWRDLRKAFDYFNGLRRDDYEGDRPRYRWDRLVVLHLLVIGFINTFGYEWQRYDEHRIEAAVSQLRYACVADAFQRTIRQLGLEDQREMKTVHRLVLHRAAAPSVCDGCAARTLRPQGERRFPRPCPGPHVPAPQPVDAPTADVSTR
jgi:hypothetical protein